jgi:acylpyruvate hydrolase
MKLLSFRREGQARLGVVRGGSVVDISELRRVPSHGSLMRSLIADGAQGLQELAEALATAKPPEYDPEGLELLPPIPDPERILCLGMNFEDHSAEMGAERAEAPNLFLKLPSCLTGSGSAIVLPRGSQEVDYEGELAVVIGSRCRNVSAEAAMGHVAGYTAINDVSARDFQFRTTQWTAGKICDTFAPMGPYLVTSDELPSIEHLRLVTRLNGEKVQDATLDAMIWSVRSTVAYISEILTLLPGDIIAMGTPAGVGWKRNPPRFLRSGDVVEVSIDGVGTLRNSVEASSTEGGGLFQELAAHGTA